MTEERAVSEEFKNPLLLFKIQKFPHALYIKLKIIPKVLLVLKAFGMIWRLLFKQCQ